MKSIVQMIVETPMGSTRKYDRDLKTGLFELTKMMPKGLAFPYDFGYIPATLGQDGDPLDIVCISASGTFIGCQLNCRILGAIQVEQTEPDGKSMRNDRYIAVAEIDEVYADITELSQLPNRLISQLETFFMTYNCLAGKKLNILNHLPAKVALQLIEESINQENQPRFRMEIILPTTDGSGKPFPSKYFNQLKGQLIEKFGGLTAYTRSPIEGYWKQAEKTISQTLNVYEVLTPEIEEKFWQTLKTKLERQFHQHQILIIHSVAGKL